jgi:hypothetical protein
VLLAALLSAVALASASAPTELPPLSAAALMRHVQVLASAGLEGRAAGSAGEAEAARYVEAELARAGLQPQRQTVARFGNPSVNVRALLTGRDPASVIVVGAHIDHLGPRFPGAEDNATGVAVVLELARALRARHAELGRSVLFVFFGAEEEGLVGSRAFVAAPPVPRARMTVMINLDMMGRPLVDQAAFGPAKRALGIDGARAMGLVGARDRPALRALVDAACAPAGVVAIAAQDLPAAVDAEISRQSEGRGDSAAFDAVGIPTLFFGSGESSDYHQPSDVIERVDAEIMQRRADALARVILALGSTPKETFATAPGPTPSPRAWTVPLGLATGWSIHRNAADGAYLGFEVSVARTQTRSLLWLGGYGDVVRDFAAKTTRLSAGPEIGVGPFGLDGGYLIELWPGGHRQGFVVRPLISTSLLAITGRFGHFTGSAPETFGEVGVLLKVPAFGRWLPASR